MMSDVKVENLSFNTTEESLKEALGQFGTLTYLRIVMDRDTGRPKGFAVATFATAAQAEQAIKQFTGKHLDGRTITVSAFTRPTPSSPDSRPARR